MNNGFRFFIPKENIAAIRAGDDKFASWPIEIDAFDGGIVAAENQKPKSDYGFVAAET